MTPIIPTYVAPGIFRGPQPQTLKDWAVLRDIGIKFTLDLETGSRWLHDGQPLVETLVADTYGIRAFSHPLGRILPPSEQELTLAYNCIERFKPIYVHCQQGVDRTGMVCAYYKMAKGMVRELAINEMKHLGMHWWYYWWSMAL